MKSTEILLQGEGIRDIEVVTLDHGADVRQLLQQATKLRHQQIDGDFHVFVEGDDEPLDLSKPIPAAPAGQPTRMHVHRCRVIMVYVTFNGQTKEHRFPPVTTVEVVKKWAAIAAFGMKPSDAAEHVLQLTGATTRPEPDTHLGALTTGKECSVRFDLVPSKRVEG